MTATHQRLKMQKYAETVFWKGKTAAEKSNRNKTSSGQKLSRLGPATGLIGSVSAVQG